MNDCEAKPASRRQSDRGNHATTGLLEINLVYEVTDAKRSHRRRLVPRGQARVEMAESAVPSDVGGEIFRGTVLVIEDETSVRSALKQVLTSRGIEVIGVATVSDAAALIKQKEFRADIVLCDYNLPGPINGVECVMSLRAALPWKLPAIVMTGDTRSKTMEAVAAHGISILVKPFLANELIQLLRLT